MYRVNNPERLKKALKIKDKKKHNKYSVILSIEKEQENVNEQQLR